jgi:hypothetical protein
MSDPERDEGPVRGQSTVPVTTESEDDEQASSPFDHPAFLPVLVWAMALWFGYDGWFNEKIESVRFNRYGFGFLVAAGTYFTLAELTRLRFLLPLALLGCALWLTGLDRLGAPDAWYRDIESARLFNRYGALTLLGLAAVFAVREALAGKRRSA